MKRITTWVLPILMTAALAGCGGQKSQEPMDVSSDPDAGGTNEIAVAELQPTAGHEAKGEVTFRKVEGGVRISANLTGLQAGEHGFHIHETGDCSSADASSAGGHYAPLGGHHGAPDDPPGQRHLGDLGNIRADAQGIAEYERIDPLLTLHDENSIVGKAVIVHQGIDDLKSQPSGAAGARVACGVIELSDAG